jgi:hypothetical protein
VLQLNPINDESEILKNQDILPERPTQPVPTQNLAPTPPKYSVNPVQPSAQTMPGDAVVLEEQRRGSSIPFIVVMIFAGLYTLLNIVVLFFAGVSSMGGHGNVSSFQAGMSALLGIVLGVGLFKRKEIARAIMHFLMYLQVIYFCYTAFRIATFAPKFLPQLFASPVIYIAVILIVMLHLRTVKENFT